MAKQSASDMRLLLSDKLAEAIMFFNESETGEARRAVEDLVDDLLETMDIEFDEEKSTKQQMVASIDLYDPTEYFTGIVIDVDE